MIKDSQAFNAGDYDANYGRELTPRRAFDVRMKIYTYEIDYDCYLLGWFASYELHEVPREYRAQVERLRNEEASLDKDETPCDD